jgi:hypothetical protein
MNTERSRYIAHVRKNEDGAFVEHLLDEHLRGVADLAGRFAAAFWNSDWAAFLLRPHLNVFRLLGVSSG